LHAVIGSGSPRLVSSSLAALLEDVLRRMRSDEYVWQDPYGMQESLDIQAGRLIAHHWDRSVDEWVERHADIGDRPLWIRERLAAGDRRGRVLSLVRPDRQLIATPRPMTSELELRVREPNVVNMGGSHEATVLITAREGSGPPATNLAVDLVLVEGSNEHRLRCLTDDNGCAVAIWPLDGPTVVDTWAETTFNGARVVSDRVFCEFDGRPTRLQVRVDWRPDSGLSVESDEGAEEIDDYTISVSHVPTGHDLPWLKGTGPSVRASIDLGVWPPGLWVVDAWASVGGRRLTAAVPFVIGSAPRPKLPLYVQVELDPQDGSDIKETILIGGETWKGSATSEDALCAPAFDLRDEGVIRGPIFDPYGLKLRDPLTAVAFERSALPDWS
jgi:hypothetical protein